MVKRPEGLRRKMVLASRRDAGITFLITSSMRSLAIFSSTGSSCWVEMSTCARAGAHGAALVLVLDGDLGLAVGASHGQVPFLRTSVRR